MTDPYAPRIDGVHTEDLEQDLGMWTEMLDRDPDDEQAASLVRTIRHLLDHPDGASDDAEMAWMREFYRLLGSGSLGAPNARAIRRRADPADVAEALRRADRLRGR